LMSLISPQIRANSKSTMTWIRLFIYPQNLCVNKGGNHVPTNNPSPI
jgi:hypothetical protein